MAFSLLNPLALAPRAIAVAASGIVHATIFASLAYGASHHASPTERVIAIETLEEVPPRPEEPAPVPEAPRPADPPPTHQHPYPVPASHDARPHDASLVHAATPVPDDAKGPPEAILAPPDTAPRFTIAVSPVSGNAAAGAVPGGSPGGGGGGGPSGTGAGDQIYAESQVSGRATLLSGATANYPPEARRQEIEADVAVEVVLDTQGRVTDAHVIKRAGFGFDESALTAIRAYRFSPAQREGHPVRVRMRWSVQFRLR